ncbi:hypothetical protein ACGFIU_09225 [Rhodococcus oryzae]|uniref:hypothetical protein n=1 Tax=Rhodococcus oryzae TaxID=2571143 RepID=UPI0037147A82
MNTRELAAVLERIDARLAELPSRNPTRDQLETHRRRAALYLEAARRGHHDLIPIRLHRDLVTTYLDPISDQSHRDHDG